MLAPKKVKHRKHHRGRMRGLAKGGTRVTFGDYGLQAVEPSWVTARQIEIAVRGEAPQVEEPVLTPVAAPSRVSSGVMVLGVNNIATLIAKCCKRTSQIISNSFSNTRRGFSTTSAM